MKIISAALVGLLFATTANAQVHVKSYVKKDGTVVEGHYRTAPNKTTSDNWSTKPNYNPYTGKQGTNDPQPNSQGGSNRSSNSSRSCTFASPCR